MKKIFLIIILNAINLFAQCKITFTDHSISTEGYIIITVFAQNLGNSQEIWAVYGPNFHDSFKKMHGNFLLSYRDIMNDNRIKEEIPSSIVIRTILDNYIPMETPTYYFPSTGLSGGQEWKLTFTNIPLDAGSVSVVVLGATLDLGDMPKAEEIRERKKILLSENIELALKKSEAKEWFAAANYWENALGLKSAIIDKHSNIISTSFCEKGKILFIRNDLNDAINIFEKAKKIDEKVFDDYSEDYSNLQYIYGEKLIGDSNINGGVESFKYSYALSKINRQKIENRLNEMKRSQFTSIALSIIPGLSQYVIQKNSTKSLLLIGAFTVSSLLTVSNKIKADNLYDEYLVASTPQDAKAKYELTDKQIKEAGLYLGLVIATVVYSIVDQYLETSRYNSLFEIKPALTTSLYNSNNYSFYLSINIPL